MKRKIIASSLTKDQIIELQVLALKENSQATCINGEPATVSKYGLSDGDQVLLSAKSGKTQFLATTNPTPTGTQAKLQYSAFSTQTGANKKFLDVKVPSSGYTTVENPGNAKAGQHAYEKLHALVTRLPKGITGTVGAHRTRPVESLPELLKRLGQTPDA